MSNITRSATSKPLGFFSLVMINIIAIDSLRSLPIAAVYGMSLVTLYGLMALVFFIPCALVVAELATGWSNTGGIYVWVREAFGRRAGFAVIFMQWIYNVIWFPTITAFVASTALYFINPQLALNARVIFVIVLSLFWIVTGINCLGMRISSMVSTVGALIGTIAPMLLIAGLGVYWLVQGNPIAINATHLLPPLKNINDFAFIGVILFGLMGLEMSAVHAGEVRNPQRDFPRALLVSVIMILLTLVAGSLAIALVIPPAKLNIITGLIEAYDLFLTALHLSLLTPVIIGLIILGSLCGISAWILGPAKGLYAAAQDGCLPKFFNKTNRSGAPYVVLLIQAGIFTLIATLFLLMPSVSNSYWILSNMSAQLALLVYVGLFAAAIRLRYRNPHVRRAFTIPCGLVGVWFVGCLGIASCVFAIILGFLPPSQLTIIHKTQYELILAVSFVAACVAPLIVYRQRSIHR